MKTLYLDLPMGAAGDMLGSALYELLNEEEKKAFLQEINEAGIPGVSITAEPSVKCGITGTHFKVTIDGQEEGSVYEHHGVPEALEGPHEDHDHHDHHHHHHHHDDHEHHHHHHHSSMAEIEQIINSLKIPDDVKQSVIKVYNIIAQAESSVHGVPVTDIHFHEVGTMDAVADITAACLLFKKIAPQKICASPVNVGFGHVHCAHGILPVPAPATALILKDIPIQSGHIEGELCTPTGAALLKYFVQGFGSMPSMTLENIGYGMGKKDFEAANCVRAMLGDAEEKPEQILEYTCNLDDISAERIAFAMEKLFEAGALEVYTIPVTMKKSRPGNLLCVMCREQDKQKILQAIFKYTTTLGVRENVSNRYGLDRTIETVDTEFGPIRIKRAEGFGVKKAKPEYEDLAAIARKTNLSIDEITSSLYNKNIL
ncbi:MAG: nickel pincer cofactor biosynthesis protein LarC [Treponema sp.]|nr:nickel pincer cofactor biosynthesis protein LarC [Treponema sp.]